MGVADEYKSLTARLECTIVTSSRQISSRLSCGSQADGDGCGLKAARAVASPFTQRCPS